MEKKNDAINLNNMEVEEVQTFLYIGATMDNCKTGWTEADKKKRLGLTGMPFHL